MSCGCDVAIGVREEGMAPIDQRQGLDEADEPRHGPQSAAPAECFGGVPVAELSQKAHWMILQAFLVAVPATLMVAAARSTLHRPRTPAAFGTPGRVVTVAVGVGLGLLVAMTLWFSVLTAPIAYQVWLERAFG